MFLNIITPCSRPENLTEIKNSINIPTTNCRWIVVIDGVEPLLKPSFPNFPEIYWHQEDGSIVGNAQRNFALDLIFISVRHENEYVYFLDDDTTLHPELWNTIKDLNNDFIHFDQATKDGIKRIGGHVAMNKIDSGSVLISWNLIDDKRWVKDKYAADGLFILEVYKYSKIPLYIPKILSTYNSLR
jgi:hypothetical protein